MAINTHGTSYPDAVLFHVSRALFLTDGNRHPIVKPLFIPKSLHQYIVCDLGKPIDSILDYNFVKSLGVSFIKKLSILNQVSPENMEETISLETQGRTGYHDPKLERLLPLLFEAYNVHAHWCRDIVSDKNIDEETLEYFMQFSPVDSGMTDGMDVTEPREFAEDVMRMVDSISAGAMADVSSQPSIYDDITMSRCGCIAFVPVLTSDYAPIDDGDETLSIYIRKLMKSIILKANTHHPETTVSKTSLYECYLNSLLLAS